MLLPKVTHSLKAIFVTLLRSIEDGKVDVEAVSTAGNFCRRVTDDELHDTSFKKLVLLMTSAKRYRTSGCREAPS